MRSALCLRIIRSTAYGAVASLRGIELQDGQDRLTGLPPQLMSMYMMLPACWLAGLAGPDMRPGSLTQQHKTERRAAAPKRHDLLHAAGARTDLTGRRAFGRDGC